MSRPSPKFCSRVILVVWFGLMTARPGLAQSVRELELSARGSAETLSDGRQSLGVMAYLSLPVETRPAPGLAVAQEVEDASGLDPNLIVPLDELETDRGQNEPKDESTLASDGTEGVSWLDIALARGAIDAAARAQGSDAALSRLEGLTSRARVSAALPDLRFRVAREVGQTLRLTPTVDDPYRFSQSGGVSTALEGSVTFRLGRLLFANEELGLERLRLARFRERERLEQRVISLLLAWDRAAVEFANRPGAAARRRLRGAELQLDLLTGGWFSEHRPAAFKSLQATAASPAVPRRAKPKSANRASTTGLALGLGAGEQGRAAPDGANTDVGTGAEDADADVLTPVSAAPAVRNDGKRAKRARHGDNAAPESRPGVRLAEAANFRQGRR